MSFYESECGTKQSSLYEVRHFYKKLYFNPGITEDTNEVKGKSYFILYIIIIHTLCYF